MLLLQFLSLLLIATLSEAERAWLPGALLCLVSGAALLGLLQFSGAAIDNPFVNETPGVVSGNFANRNHFALFLALGCLLAPVWAFHGRRQAGWRAPVALGLVLLFALTILAGGSRAGLALGMVALSMALIASAYASNPTRPSHAPLAQHRPTARIGGLMPMSIDDVVKRKRSMV